MNFLKKLFGNSGTFTPKRQATSPAMQVTFQREVRKQHPVMPKIQTVTKIYTAPSREVAAAFLHTQNITEEFLYIEVETPSGVFGIDRMGRVYDTRGLQVQKAPSQSETSDWKALSQTFYDAAENDDLEKVKSMLQDHSNLVFSKITFFGDTPLHTAASNGHKDVVELLLAKGADVNVVDQNNQTPLHDTAGHGHIDVVKLLLDKGADVNPKMHGGLTPLEMATRKNHKGVVQLLRQHGGRA
jgi:hypothetical protein